MKKHTLYALPVTLVMMQASPLALAQAVPELDVTIMVLEEGQTPAGFIRQLELPPADFFTAGEAQATTGIDANDSVAASAAADVAIETLNNTVRETISIDGTAAIATEAVALVPVAIVDVLDSELPLVDSLQDVLDGVIDILPPLDGVGNIVDDVTGGVGNVVDNVTGGVGNVVDNVTGGAGNVVDDVTGGVGNIVDNLTGGGAGQILDPGLGGIVDNLTDPLDIVVPIVDNLGDVLPGLGTGVLNLDATLQGATDIRTALPLVDEVRVEGLADTVAGDSLDVMSPELPVSDLLENLPANLSDLLP